MSENSCRLAARLLAFAIDPRRRTARHQLLGGLRDSAREPRSLLALAARDDAVLGLPALLATARSAPADRIELRLPLIEQPTVVLRGQYDGFVDQTWAEQAVALLPHGRLVVVPGEPHAVHYTRPDLVARVVQELLVEECEQTGGQPIPGLPSRAGAQEGAHVRVTSRAFALKSAFLVALEKQCATDDMLERVARRRDLV